MSNETDPVVQTEPAAAENITASVRKPRAKRASTRTSQNRAGRRASGKTKTAAPAPKMGMLNKLVNGSIVIAVFVTALAIQRIVPTEHIAAPKVEALPAQTAVAPTAPTTPETATATQPVTAPTVPTTPAVAPAVSTTPAAPVAAPAPVTAAAPTAPQATTPAPVAAVAVATAPITTPAATTPTVAAAAPVAATTPAAPVAAPVVATTPAAPILAPAPVVASAPTVVQAPAQATPAAPVAQPCVAPAPQPVVATSRVSRRSKRDGYNSGGRTDDRKTALNSGGAEDLDNPSVREHYINTSKLAKRAASPTPAAEANRTELPAAVPNRVR